MAINTDAKLIYYANSTLDTVINTFTNNSFDKANDDERKTNLKHIW